MHSTYNTPRECTYGEQCWIKTRVSKQKVLYSLTIYCIPYRDTGKLETTIWQASWFVQSTRSTITENGTCNTNYKYIKMR